MFFGLQIPVDFVNRRKFLDGKNILLKRLKQKSHIKK